MKSRLLKYLNQRQANNSERQGIRSQSPQTMQALREEAFCLEAFRAFAETLPDAPTEAASEETQKQAIREEIRATKAMSEQQAAREQIAQVKNKGGRPRKVRPEENELAHKREPSADEIAAALRAADKEAQSR